jgi:colanic acid biosynthesis glycosyl transferase WcaI
MHIVVHDYSGHPFQLQLSRELVARGHTVSHWHCSSYATGKGRVTRQKNDPVGLSIVGIPMSAPFQRYSLSKRLRQEISYGRALGRRLVRRRPDVVLFCNTPLIAHAVAARACVRSGIPMVFWQQDIYSAAIGTAAAKRLGTVGRLIGRLAARLERSIARESKAVIAISSEFLDVLKRWGVSERTTVIPNWAPLPEIPVRPRDNTWASEHDLVGRHVVLYSGTLGLKHNPAVLAHTARAMQEAFPEARLVVISEGLGRDWLAEHKAEEGLGNLLLLDYQPYDRLPDVLGSADVLVAILEPSAGRYSVPSKVLTYLCAGRAIVAVIPDDNSAASVLRSSAGGIVIPPGRDAIAAHAILDLLRDEPRRSSLALAGRRYSEETFKITRIADRFEIILAGAAGPHGARRPTNASQPSA